MTQELQLRIFSPPGLLKFITAHTYCVSTMRTEKEAYYYLLETAQLLDNDTTWVKLSRVLEEYFGDKGKEDLPEEVRVTGEQFQGMTTPPDGCHESRRLGPQELTPGPDEPAPFYLDLSLIKRSETQTVCHSQHFEDRQSNIL